MWHYKSICMLLYICPNSRNEQHQEWNLTDFGWKYVNLGSSVTTNILLWSSMLIMREATCTRAAGIWKISVPFPQYHCESMDSLKRYIRKKISVTFFLILSISTLDRTKCRHNWCFWTQHKRYLWKCLLVAPTLENKTKQNKNSSSVY